MKNLCLKEYVLYFLAIFVILISFAPMYIATNYQDQLGPQIYEVATRTITWLLPFTCGVFMGILTYCNRNELRRDKPINRRA